MKKSTLVAFLGLTCALAIGPFALTGCASSNQASNTENDGQSTSTSADQASTEETSATPTEDAIKVEDLPCTAKNATEDGYRRVSIDFTNNTNYTIVTAELKFTFKEDVSDDELDKAFKAFKKDHEVTNEELRDASLIANYRDIVKPGETSKNNYAEYGSIYATSTDQYDLMEPDMLTVKYLVDNTLYEETYDYKNKSYTLDDETIDTTQWGLEKMADMVPQPKNMYVVEMTEDSDSFKAKALGATKDLARSYIKECKEAGFKKNSNVSEYSTDFSYSALSKNGKYTLTVDYRSYDNSIEVRVEKKK